MAIDFSQVKTITIPEGSVTKITDSTGAVLWQGVGWHTIWEGSKTCSVELNNDDPSVISGNENNFVQTVAGTGYTPKIRVTFSYSISNHSSSFKNYFQLNGSKVSTLSSSPVIIDKIKENNYAITYTYTSVVGAGVEYNDTHFAYARLEQKKNVENNNIIFNLKAYQYMLEGGNYGAYFTITFTVTKIEQYY